MMKKQHWFSKRLKTDFFIFMLPTIQSKIMEVFEKEEGWLSKKQIAGRLGKGSASIDNSIQALFRKKYLKRKIANMSRFHYLYHKQPNHEKLLIEMWT